MKLVLELPSHLSIADVYNFLKITQELHMTIWRQYQGPLIEHIVDMKYGPSSSSSSSSSSPPPQPPEYDQEDDVPFSSKPS